MDTAVKFHALTGLGTDVDYRRAGYTENERVFNGCVNYAVASIVQAARDIAADCAVHDGMSSGQQKRRKRMAREKIMAISWVKNPNSGHISLMECVDYVNYALVASRRPEIPLDVLQKMLIESPETIVSAFHSGTQTTPREPGFDDLDYLMVSGQ